MSSRFAFFVSSKEQIGQIWDEDLRLLGLSILADLGADSPKSPQLWGSDSKLLRISE